MADTTFAKCAKALSSSISEDERIMRIRLGQPRSSRADYFTRYKVDFATLNGMQASNWRCVVVNVSSNTGSAEIDGAVSCNDVPDLLPFPSSPTAQEVASTRALGEEMN